MLPELDRAGSAARHPDRQCPSDQAIVEWLRTCAAVVRYHVALRARDAQGPPAADDFVEAVRAADRLLLHVIDTQAFARRVAPAEGPDPR